MTLSTHRTIATLLFAATLCAATVAQAATPAQATAAQSRLTKMAPGSTTSCEVGAGGNIDCMVDGVHADVTECTGDYAWGQVSDKDGVTLESAFDKSKAAPTAHLGERQFLCVAASVGRTQMPERYYVVAFPIKDVSGCKENQLCQERPQSWVSKKPDEACHWVGKSGDFTGACAAGWVDSDSVEVFSTGLR